MQRGNLFVLLLKIRRRMRKLPIYICLFTFLAVSCAKKDSKTDSDRTLIQAINKSNAVKIAVMPTIDALPLLIAYERGWMEKDNLNVIFLRFSAHMDIDTALIGGSVDGAFTDIFRTEYISQKKKLSFYYLTSTELTWSLVSNKAARLNRLDQFGDKMVASTRFSATDYLTDKKFEGVNVRDPFFKVQINDVRVRYNMLINNEMDSEWLPEPWATKAQMEGHKILVKPKKNDMKFGVLAFRKQFAMDSDNKSFLSALSKVYSEACDSINKYGIKNYAAEMQKYCDADTAVINRLPRIMFTHTERPDDTIIKTVDSYIR